VATIAYYTCSQIWDAVVTRKLDDTAEELVKTLSEDDKKELEEEMDQASHWFLPFPGTIKQLPQQPFSTHHPEYQAFLQFSKDPKAVTKTREELIQLLSDVCTAHPGYVSAFGNDWKVRRQWLDIDFPKMPSVKYAQSGLLISDTPDETSIMFKYLHPVDAGIVARLNSVLMPIAGAKTLFYFTKDMVSIMLWPSQPLEDVWADFQTGKMVGKSLDFARKAVSAEVMPEPGAAKAVTRIFTLGQSEAHSGSWDAKRFSDYLAVHPPLITAWRLRCLQFLRSAHAPPSGCLLATGLVEFETSRAFVVLDVKAPWNPATAEYHKPAIKVEVRRWNYKTSDASNGGGSNESGRLT
jgi:hypothetical protein